jgi:hypothetical protein
MDDLRHDVIEAFDRGQAELEDLQGVRERMLRGAYAGRSSRHQSRLQLAAGLAAILIAALVIATFVYVRAVTQPNPAGKLNVAASTPVILFHDPANIGQIDGITWDGRSSGRVGGGGVNGGTSNPAGTLYATGTDIRDRTGRVVGPLANTPARTSRVTWADDELHYCQVVPAPYKGVGPGPGMLQLVLPGGQASNVAQIGTFAPASQNLPPPIVAVCSVENDRAVVFQSTGSSGDLTVQDWVIQVSTGHILWTHVFKLPAAPVGFAVVATHDGQFVAETILSPLSTSTSTIYGPDGSAITHLASAVDTFSWDGSLVVTSSGTGTPVTLIRWRDGTVVWAGPAGLPFRTARSEPGGTRIAITLIANLSVDPTAALTINLYVVSADGRLLWSKNNVNLN